MINTNNYCVILAGGYGTRLWPLSRQQKPKQFHDFLGRGETLLQSTYKRYKHFIETPFAKWRVEIRVILLKKFVFINNILLLLF